MVGYSQDQLPLKVEFDPTKDNSMNIHAHTRQISSKRYVSFMLLHFASGQQHSSELVMKISSPNVKQNSNYINISTEITVFCVGGSRLYLPKKVCCIRYQVCCISKYSTVTLIVCKSCCKQPSLPTYMIANRIYKG